MAHQCPRTEVIWQHWPAGGEGTQAVPALHAQFFGCVRYAVLRGPSQQGGGLALILGINPCQQSSAYNNLLYVYV